MDVPEAASPGSQVTPLPPEFDHYRLHGDEAPSIIAAGHSHVLSLLAALEAGRGPGSISAAVAYNPELLGVPLEDEYWDFVVGRIEDRVVVVSWSGNYHLADFLLVGESPLHVYGARTVDRTNDDGIWVPQEMLRALWGHAYQQLTDVLPRLVAKAKAVIVVGTPPPKGDAHVRGALMRESFFASKATDLELDPATVRLTEEVDRVAMWQVTQDMLREHATASGAEFLPVPDEAVDQIGLLLPEYSGPDVTHANVEYGALQWSVLHRHLKVEVFV